jgi:hypothetical protein
VKPKVRRSLDIAIAALAVIVFIQALLQSSTFMATPKPPVTVAMLQQRFRAHPTTGPISIHTSVQQTQLTVSPTVPRKQGMSQINRAILINTGPSDEVAIFIGATLLGFMSYQLYLRSSSKR